MSEAPRTVAQYHGPTMSVALPQVCPLCGVDLSYTHQPWSSVLTIHHGRVRLIADTKAITHGPPYTRTVGVALREHHERHGGIAP